MNDKFSDLKQGKREVLLVRWCCLANYTGSFLFPMSKGLLQEMSSGTLKKSAAEDLSWWQVH